MKKLLLFICFFPLMVYSQWNQLGSSIIGENVQDYFGNNVALSNDGLTMAVGAPYSDANGFDSGKVKVYKFQSGSWVQYGQSLVGDNPNDNFGGVSISLPHGQKTIALNSTGNVLVVGASGSNSNTGYVSVYEYISGTWVLKGAKINGAISGEYSGFSVDISDDGNIVAIGSPMKNIVTGSVKVYEYLSGNWILRGQELSGDVTYDRFGSYVSLNSAGTVLAVSAPMNDANGNSAGRVKVYSYQTGTGKSAQNINGTWAQIGSSLDGQAANDIFGGSLSLNASGNILVVGAPFNAGKGSTYVYQYSGAWNLIGTKITGSVNADEFGFSVDINSNGTKIVAGSRVNDGNGNASGQVRVFENIANVWTQVGSDVYGGVAEEFGTAVNINATGTVFIGGTPRYQTNKGYVKVYTTDALLSNNGFELEENEIKLYPNPAKTYFELATSANVEKIVVYSIQGRLVKSFSNQNQYEINDLAKGIYVLKIKAKEGVINKTLIIE